MGRFAEDLLARAERLQQEKPKKRRSDVGDSNQAKTWTPAKEARLVTLYNEGLTNIAIGLLLGKTANAIGIKINRLRAEGILGDRPNDKR
ncbi:hypothetical protein [Kosakonia phage Kc259]|nr:hypothetical protein [Kosakonia phage Kc259]